ncbi:hypothetical protein GQ602_006232 [Ophiocordyceps camponoti-floridani]|uniref:Heat-labile enterotoxin n=1 Tax=Ophiocordyceps camponoti-floridani TaxID=2030778 RepID=A0A8H4VBI9_9HYPO|nr:hypothetical protein GQ602_006232 [Ophiocordyceps camponoti-floridani]
MHHHWIAATLQAAFYLLLWTSHASASSPNPARPPVEGGDAPLRSAQTGVEKIFARRPGKTTSSGLPEPTPGTSGLQDKKFYEEKPRRRYHGSTINRSLKSSITGGPGMKGVNNQRLRVIRDAYRNPLLRDPPPRIRNFTERMTDPIAAIFRRLGNQGVKGFAMGLVRRRDDERDPSDDSDDEGLMATMTVAERMEYNLARANFLLGLFDPSRYPTPEPDASRELPPPEPTGCSEDNTPLYKHWYHWNSINNDRSLREDGSKPYQLIPKRGGCYLPYPGAVGSYFTDCLPPTVKGSEGGFPPRLTDFPGGLGSTWHFRDPDLPFYSPQSSSDTSEDSGQDVCWRSAGVPQRRDEQRQELEEMMRFMDWNPGLVSVKRAGNLIYDIMLMVAGDVPRGMAAVHDGCVGVIVTYIMDLAPHFIEILLHMWAEMVEQYTRQKRSSPGTGHGNETETRRWLCDWLLYDVPVYYRRDENPVMNGIYVNCSRPNERVRGLEMGNLHETICNAFQGTAMSMHSQDGKYIVPSVLLDCKANTSLTPTIDTSSTTSPDLETYNNHDKVFPGEDSMGVRMTSSSLSSRQRDSCLFITNLKLGFQLDRGGGSATTDTISFTFNSASRKTTIIRNPWSGFHTWMKLDIPTLFTDLENVTLTDIHSIQLHSHRNQDDDDGWGLQGLKLRAKCHGSDKTWEVDKWSSLNAWLFRPDDKVEDAMLWQDTVKAVDWIPNKYLESCRVFDSLEFSLFRGPHRDGLGDQSRLLFKYAGTYPIKFDAKMGWQAWQTIDLQKKWSSSTISIEEIRWLGIRQLFVGEPENHRWDIPRFRIRGHCQGNHRHVVLRFDNIQPQKHEYEGQKGYAIWETAVDPERDWLLLSDCSRFDQLIFKMGISGDMLAGTTHSLYFSFARDRHGSPPEQFITTGTRENYMYHINVDLRKMFGTDYVYMEDLDYIKVFDRSWGQKQDPWMATKIFFEARCADDHSQIYVHEDIYVERMVHSSWSPDSDVSRDIDTNGWHLYDWEPRTKEVVQTHLHDGSEF